jgi:hypothetical protein
MDWFKRLFRSSATFGPDNRPTRRVTANHPVIIESPRLGFLNLLGPLAQTMLDEDKAALRLLFSSSQENETGPPQCDVLMIYARIQTDGTIVGYSGGLRDIIRQSRAPIVVVASENDVQSYVAAGKKTGSDQANLVMTLKRRGPVFGKFLTDLFQKMLDGKSMPLAWVELAPQNPGAAQENRPEAIFSAEVSHIVFK